MADSTKLEEADEELIIATADGRQDVISMCGDVYYGIDYLQDTYDHLVQGHGVKAFLYKIKGELVAFVSTQVSDGGRSLLLKAARVKPAFQGGGVYGRFRRKIFEQFSDKDQYPDLQRELATLNLGNTEKSQKAMIKAGWRQVQAKHNPMPIFKASNLSRLPEVRLHHQVTKMTKDDLNNLFNADPSEWLHLFSNKRLIIAWTPYVVGTDDLDLLFNAYDVQFFATKAAAANGRSSGDEDSINKVAKTESCSKFLLITAGSYYKCRWGISYHVDVFGDAVDGDDLIEDHVNTHLQRLKAMSKDLTDDVVFNVFADSRLDKTVEKTTKELDTFKGEGLQQHEMCVLWERDLQTLS